MDRTPFQPRAYLAEDFDPASKRDRRHVFVALGKELKAAKTGRNLEVWLAHYGELDDALGEEGDVRSLESIRHADDLALQQAEADFNGLMDLRIVLLGRLLKHPALGGLPASYDLFLRRMENKVELFRKENRDSEEKEAALKYGYRAISGAMTFSFAGREQMTSNQMEQMLEDHDQSLRREAWETAERGWAAKCEDIDLLYDQQLALRHDIAVKAGFKNYLEYKFRAMDRVDYRPEDSERWHEMVERHAVPLKREMEEEHRKSLGLDVLRPWDMDVDPEGKASLRSFKNGDELFAGAREIIRRLDPEWAAQFSETQEKGMLDLEARPGKAPGAFNYYFAESRRCFIYMNAVGTLSDMTLLRHEMAHYLNNNAARHQPFFGYRDVYASEYAEIPSMGMELLGAAHFDAVYSPAEAQRAKKKTFKEAVDLLALSAAVDSFEQWAYKNPGHSHEERHRAWGERMERFGGIEKWDGHEEARRTDYIRRKHHIFTVPLFYGVYGITQMGALQLWQKFAENPQETLKDYKHALSLGSSRPLPELYEATGLKFDPRGELLPGLIATVRKELERTGQPVSVADKVPRLDFRRSPGAVPETALGKDLGKAV